MMLGHTEILYLTVSLYNYSITFTKKNLWIRTLLILKRNISFSWIGTDYWLLTNILSCAKSAQHCESAIPVYILIYCFILQKAMGLVSVRET